MPHRAHLQTVQLFSAFRQAVLGERYGRKRFFSDLMAGASIGMIALPLSMALAIASGVPPQHGLYTAMIAGFIIALTGGSRFSVSGPTAAFVVILHPVSQQFGLGGLLVAGLMAGAMLVLMGLARLGRFIEYIPEQVTLGFTAGIAIVIALLQVKDFLGLPLADMPEDFLARIGVLATHLGDAQWNSLLVGGVTLLVLIGWRRLRLPLPPHLPALLVGVGVSLLLAANGQAVDTIGSRFSFVWPDGSLGQGIPPFLPEFAWPWQQPGPDGQPLVWDLDLIRALLPAAFSIAALGAIESLLCAVVLDGMTGYRHRANGELLGQGVGNLVTPFFGGIVATAALARSAANVRAGATSPVSPMVHAVVVLVALVLLAPWLAYLPMASMAAILLVVAWHMSEAHKVVRLIRKAPLGDVAVLLTCLSLTVVFDMVIAISVGVVLASLLFMRDIAAMTRVSDISQNHKLIDAPLPAGWAVYKINGPLFFAAADRVFSEIEMLADGKAGIVLYMDGVPILDAGGLSACETFLRRMEKAGVRIIVADLQFQPLKTLARAHLQALPEWLEFTATLQEGLVRCRQLAASEPTDGGDADDGRRA